MILKNLKYLPVGLFKRSRQIGFDSTFNELKKYYLRYIELLKRIDFIPSKRYKFFLIFNYFKIVSLIPDIDKFFLLGVVPKMFAKNYLAHRINPPSEKGILVDKNKFYRLMKENTIPIPETYFYTRNGAFYNLEDNLVSDLSIYNGKEMFIKSLAGSSGKDADIIIFDSKYKYKDNLIFQEMLESHPEIYELCPVKAVPTLRINTYLKKDGKIEYDSHFIKLPPKDAKTDNSFTGCLMISINPQNGQLIKYGLSKDGEFSNGKRIIKHFDSEIEFKDCQLPFWNEIRDLIIKLHSLFPKLRFIGWDIAITEEGPVVIEGNSIGDILFEQLVSGPFYNKKLIQENINKND